MSATLRIRPTISEAVYTKGYTGDYLNPELAIDDDAATPATFATLERSKFGTYDVSLLAFLHGFEHPRIIGTITSVVLTVWSETIDDTAHPSYAVQYTKTNAAPLDDYTAPSGIWAEMADRFGGSTPLSADSESLPNDQDLTLVGVIGRIVRPPGAPPPDSLSQLNIYDCYIDVTGDFITISTFPGPDPIYSIPRTLVDKKIRTALQGGDLDVRSQGPDPMALDLTFELSYDQYDTLTSFYQAHGAEPFHFVDSAPASPVTRLVKFTGPPTAQETAFNTVVWKCTLQEVPE